MLDVRWPCWCCCCWWWWWWWWCVRRPHRSLDCAVRYRTPRSPQCKIVTCLPRFQSHRWQSGQDEGFSHTSTIVCLSVSIYGHIYIYTHIITYILYIIIVIIYIYKGNKTVLLKTMLFFGNLTCVGICSVPQSFCQVLRSGRGVEWHT